MAKSLLFSAVLGATSITLLKRPLPSWAADAADLVPTGDAEVDATVSVTAVTQSDGSKVFTEAITLSDDLPFFPKSETIPISTETASGIEAVVLSELASLVSGKSAKVALSIVDTSDGAARNASSPSSLSPP